MKRPHLSIEPGSAEELEAVERCFEAFGADIAKWPADARAHFGAVAASDAFADAREDAASLDSFLGAATQPQPNASLIDRIMASYPPPAPSHAWFADLRGALAGLRLVPAGALAGFGALGLAAGVLTGNTQALAPEYEAYAYMEDLMALAALDEEGAQWDAD